MSLNRRKLKEWVTRKLLTPPLAEDFSLWHVGKHAPNLVSQLASACNDPNDRPHEIEQQVSQEVADHIEAWPGRQQYVVKVFDAEGSEIGEYPFSMNARHAQTDAGDSMMMLTPDIDALNMGQLGSDFSHPSALVTTQQMRHNEALVRYVVELSAMSRERDAHIIAAQQRSIDKAEGRRLEQIELLEEMYCRRQERSIRQQKYDEDKSRKERLLGNLTTMVLPEIARRAAGMPVKASVGSNGAGSNGTGSNGTGSNGAGSNGAGGGGAHGESADIAAIRDIFLKLPAEMQNAFADALSAEDQVTLFSLFKGGPGPQPSQEQATPGA